jgi:hypothetical protein
MTLPSIKEVGKYYLGQNIKLILKLWSYVLLEK